MDNKAKNKLTRSIKLLPMAVAALVITGCSITPKAIDHETQLNNTYKGLHDALNAQQPINHKITLSEAIARTLKYNLDHKVQQAQLMLESGNLKAAYMEMLPALNASVDYSFRNNDLIQNLVNSDGQVVSGEQSFTPREVINQSYGLQCNEAKISCVSHAALNS